MENTQSVCSHCTLLILLSVNYFAPPCVMFVHMHSHLFSKPQQSLNRMCLFSYLLPGLCIHAIEFMCSFSLCLCQLKLKFSYEKKKLTWKGEIETVNSAAHDGCKSHAFQLLCMPRAHFWLSLSLLSYGIDLAERGFPRTSLSFNSRQLKRCLVSDSAEARALCAVFKA